MKKVRNRTHKSARWAKKLHKKFAAVPASSAAVASLSEASADMLTGRTMVLLDIENFCGMSNPSVEAIQLAQQVIQHELPSTEESQIIIACDISNIANVGFTWQGGFELRMGEGKDGADYQLLDELVNGRLHERFENVVVVSGDHIFADALRELERKGVNTHVLSHRFSISAELYTACKNTRVL